MLVGLRCDDCGRAWDEYRRAQTRVAERIAEDAGPDMLDLLGSKQLDYELEDCLC